MKDKEFSVIMILGMLIPALLLMILASSGLGLLRTIFEHIPLIKGGMINTNFLNESILLNSASVYMAFVSAIICSFSVIPLVKIKEQYDSEEVAYIIFMTMIMTLIAFIFLFFMRQRDLVHTVPPFFLMSGFYFTTCLYYFFSTCAYSVFCFFYFILILTLPIKLLIRRLK